MCTLNLCALTCVCVCVLSWLELHHTVSDWSMITIDTLMMDMNKSDCDEIRLLQGYLSPTFITCVYVCKCVSEYWTGHSENRMRIE